MILNQKELSAALSLLPTRKGGRVILSTDRHGACLVSLHNMSGELFTAIIWPADPDDSLAVPIYVPAAPFVGAIKTAAGPVVELSLSDSNILTIQTGSAAGEILIDVTPDPDLIIPEHAPQPAVFSGPIAAAIADLLDAVSTDGTRPQLCGIAIRPDGLWQATDGRRYVSKQLASAVPDPAALPEQIIIPDHIAAALAKAAGRRKKVDDSICLEVRPSGHCLASAAGGVFRVYFKPLDGKFPDLAGTLPDFADPALDSWEFDAADLRRAIRLADCLSTRKAGAAAYLVPGPAGAWQLQADSLADPGNSFCYDLDSTGPAVGPESTMAGGIRFNLQFLADMIGKTEGAIRAVFTGAQRPAGFFLPGQSDPVVIMPMTPPKHPRVYDAPAVVETAPAPAAVVETAPAPVAVVETAPAPVAVVETAPAPVAVVETAPAVLSLGRGRPRKYVQIDPGRLADITAAAVARAMAAAGHDPATLAATIGQATAAAVAGAMAASIPDRHHDRRARPAGGVA